MVAVVWQFHIRPGSEEAFERFYGADGDWTKLSRRSRSFLGSSFLRDIAVEGRYVLVEYRGEMVVYKSTSPTSATSCSRWTNSANASSSASKRLACSPPSTCPIASARPGRVDRGEHQPSADSY